MLKISGLIILVCVFAFQNLYAAAIPQTARGQEQPAIAFDEAQAAAQPEPSPVRNDFRPEPLSPLSPPKPAQEIHELDKRAKKTVQLNGFDIGVLQEKIVIPPDSKLIGQNGKLYLIKKDGSSALRLDIVNGHAVYTAVKPRPIKENPHDFSIYQDGNYVREISVQFFKQLAGESNVLSIDGEGDELHIEGRLTLNSKSDVKIAVTGGEIFWNADTTNKQGRLNISIGTGSDIHVNGNIRTHGGNFWVGTGNGFENTGVISVGAGTIRIDTESHPIDIRGQLRSDNRIELNAPYTHVTIHVPLNGAFDLVVDTWGAVEFLADIGTQSPLRSVTVNPSKDTSEENPWKLTVQRVITTGDQRYYLSSYSNGFSIGNGELISRRGNIYLQFVPYPGYPGGSLDPKDPYFKLLSSRLHAPLGEVFLLPLQSRYDGPPLNIPPLGRTLGGLQFPPQVTSLVDIDQAGNLSFLAGNHATNHHNALLIVDTSNSSSPKMLSTVNFDTPLLDILATPDGKGVFVLEQGLGEYQYRISRLWRVNVTDPSHPVLELMGELRNGERLTFHDDPVNGPTVQVYFGSEVDGQYFAAVCPMSGPCSINSVDNIPGALFHTYENGDSVSSNVGSSSLVMASQRLNGVRGTDTPAPVAFFSSKGNYLFVSLKNGTLLVYDPSQVTRTELNITPIPVVKTVNTQGKDPIFNLIVGNRLAVLDSTGLIEIFDITNPLNPILVDSMSMPGAKRLDFDGNNLFVVTDNQYRIIGPA